MSDDNISDDSSLDSLPEVFGGDVEDLAYLEYMSQPEILSSTLHRGEFNHPAFIAYLDRLRRMTTSQFCHVFQNNPGSEALLRELLSAKLLQIMDDIASLR